MKMAPYFRILLFLAMSSISVRGTSRTEIISKNPLYIVSWELGENNEEKPNVTFNLTVETRGFVGFGISKSGGMLGADIIIGGVHPNGTAYLSDRHGIGNQAPPEDSHRDWEPISIWENETHTHLQVSRLLETCDLEDVTITQDTLKFIWSVGSNDTDTPTYHGPTHRGSYSVSILGEPYPDVDLTRYDTFDATTVVTMPAKDTTYWCTVHKAPVFGGKQHAVAFGPVLMGPLSERHSHHLSLYKCTAPEGEDPEEFFQKYIVQGGIDCLEPKSGQISAYRYCTQLIYTFTIGGREMLMPDGVGFPIGEEPHVFYLMESHFDNPEMLANITFETGVRIYHTDELRPIEAGVVRVGQMYDYNLVIPPSSSDYIVVGHCSSNCTKQWVPEEGVDIFNVMLHSHAYGKKMKFRQFRNGKEEEWVINDENYDNDYQDNRNIPLRKVLPGDQFAIECIYDTTELNPPTAVLGGFSTRREMCEVVYYYYPKMGLENCRSSILKENIRNFFGVTVRELGDSLTNPEILTPVQFAGMSFMDYLNMIEWTPDDHQSLQNLTLHSLHAEQCGGDGFQKSGNGNPSAETYYVTYPNIDEEYVPPKPDCPTYRQ